MGRRPCCSKEGLNRGPWTALEDKILIDYIKLHGEGQWRNLPVKEGLKRCGKSRRLRWLNYLRPGIIRGNISSEEEELIIRLHKLLGNRWSLIAGRLPGRADNEIKNYWNTNIRKRVQRVQETGLKRSYRTKRNQENRIDDDDDNNNKVKVINSNVVRTKAFKVSSKVNFFVDTQPQDIHRSSIANRKVALTSSIGDGNEDNDRLQVDPIFMNSNELRFGEGENEKDHHHNANQSAILDSNIHLSELFDFDDFSTELNNFDNFENNHD